MSLSSVFSTAISGLNASQTTISVAGNNVANANTNGFKSSEAIFATQFLQTLSDGSAPSDTNGGTNPEQTGLGVQVAGIDPNFAQGTLQTSSNPADLAIQGDGFFVVKGSAGQQLYTRDGEFHLNAINQLTTVSGSQLLGYGVDANFQIQATQLAPLTIPLGSTSVAKATQNVNLQGTLSPTGNVATAAQIDQSQVLGDASYTAPSSSTKAIGADVPNSSTSTAAGANGAGGGMTASSAYQYVVVFANGSYNAASAKNNPPGTTSVASAPIDVTLGAGDNEATLNNIPTDASGNYTTRLIYRTTANPGSSPTYQLVGQINDNTTTSYTDTTSDATLATNQTLDTGSLSGDYSYYVTFADALGNESRPSQLVGPISVVNGRVELTNLPTDASGKWSSINIYRNTATDATDFHQIGSVPLNSPGQTYTDDASDASIASGKALNVNGPTATNNTKLVDLLTATPTGSTALFPSTGGTLSFTGDKGGSTLSTKTLAITSSTTVGNLLEFIQGALGIQNGATIPTSTGTTNPPGVTIQNGQIVVTSNNGTDSAATIPLSAFQLTTTSGAAAQVNLAFNSTQSAIGAGAVANFVAYDSLGVPINVRVTTELESVNGSSTTYRWYADSPNNSPASAATDPSSASNIAVGTGEISFNGQGSFVSATNSTVAIQRAGLPSTSPLSFNLDFSQITGLAATSNTLAATSQDGFAPGKLSSYTIGQDGTITGVFDNGTQRTLGRIELAHFANPQGLTQQGNNEYAEGNNSGLPVVAKPGEEGTGTIVSGAVELSNTDIGQSLIELITASSDYRGNAQVISSAQTLLDVLLQLK
jgi:flagellar hook protein FlgE